MGTFVKIFVDQFKFISQYNNGSENPAALWMWVLGFVGFGAFVIIIDRFIVWKNLHLNKKAFINPLLDSLKRKDLNKAIGLCNNYRKKNNPMAEIIYRGIVSNNIDEYDSTTQEARLEIFPKLRKRTNFLNLFQSIATLIGLAGTIFGLILAFDAVGGENASDSSRMLAAGISAAMGTTIGGLFIAIPTLMIGTIISYKIEGIIYDMETYIKKVGMLLK